MYCNIFPPFYCKAAFEKTSVPMGNGHSSNLNEKYFVYTWNRGMSGIYSADIPKT